MAAGSSVVVCVVVCVFVPACSKRLSQSWIKSREYSIHARFDRCASKETTPKCFFTRSGGGNHTERA